MTETLTGIVWLDALLVGLAAIGYPAVFLAGTLENLFIVGGFVPGETIVMAVAFLASRDRHLSIWAVWACSVLGTVAGSNISYAIGRQGGRPLLERLLRRFPRLDRTLDQAAEYFEIHGAKTVLIARFTAGFKNFVPALAGVGRMRLRVFELHTLIGAVLYSTGLCILGYKFGENLELVTMWAKRAGVWAAVAAAVLAGGYVAYRVWRSRSVARQVAEHEAEELAAAPAEDGAPGDGTSDDGTPGDGAPGDG